MVCIVKHYCCEECFKDFDHIWEAQDCEKKHKEKEKKQIQKRINTLDKKLGYSKAIRRYKK